jgi:protein-tyrosine kinase
MSRIQDILAKAERDGTARRTQTTEFTSRPAAPMASPLPPAPLAAPLIAGTSALDSSAFPPSAAAVSVAAPAPETRTAVATLHPLLVAAIDPHSPVAEQYRTVRARISHREETMSLRSLLVTSPGDGEGKSITAANLALTMAQEFQRRVVLVDADFRGPTVHSLFGISGAPGLAELLAGEATLDEVVIYLPDYRLSIVPAGLAPHFPTELLGSGAMRRTMDALRARFDRVLFDMPAAMPFADAGTLAPMADGVLMVVRSGVTLRPVLDEAIAIFDEPKLVGVVLNDAQ